MKVTKRLNHPSISISCPSTVDERWSMDFMHDQLATGRKLRTLNIMDDYSRKLVGKLVGHSNTSMQIARFLDEQIFVRSKSRTIVCDNSSEFTCKALFKWLQKFGVPLSFIELGESTSNTFAEKLNGKFRKDCLSHEWFISLNDVNE